MSSRFRDLRDLRDLRDNSTGIHHWMPVLLFNPRRGARAFGQTSLKSLKSLNVGDYAHRHPFALARVERTIDTLGAGNF